MIDRMWIVEGVMAVVVLLTVGLVFLKQWLNRRAGVASVRRPTWGCAFTAPDKRMQYTASSYNRELQTMWGDRQREATSSALPEEEIFPAERAFSTEDRDTTARAVTHWFAHLLRRGTARLALFQTGKTNHYVLHALVLFVLILILSLCEAL